MTKLMLFQHLLIALIFSYSDQALAKPAENCDQRCQNVRRTIAKTKGAIVGITTWNSSGRRPLNAGSGFFWGKSCTIVTNAHVVDKATTIGVSLAAKRLSLKARVIAKDDRLDLALLKLEKKFLCKTLKMGNQDDVAVATPVISIGSPYGVLSETVHIGAISAVQRALGNKLYHRYIQFNAAIFPGNSGGPLVTLDGRVIGITTLASRQRSGLAFAFPAHVFARIFNELKSSGSLKKRYLGIRALQRESENKRSLLDYKMGVIVESIRSNSPAQKAGLKPKDIIIGTSRVPLLDINSLEMELYSHPIGHTITLRVLRKGKEIKLTLPVVLAQS